MKNHWQEDVGTHRKKKKKKDTPCPGTKEKPLQDSRRGTIMLKSNPLPAGWVTHKLKKFSHCCKHSRLHIRLDNLGVRQRDRESQGIWLWRTAGFDYRTSTGLGETETLGGHKQNLVGTRTQGKEAVSPKETESDLPVSIWRLVGVQYATVEEQRNSSRKNEEAGPKPSPRKGNARRQIGYPRKPYK